jgi:hypothetical protein
VVADQEVDIPFPTRGIGRAFNYTKSNPDTTPEAVNIIPYDPAEHRYRGGSRPGFPAVVGFTMDGPPVFLMSFAPPAEIGEQFRQSFLAATRNSLYINETFETVVGGVTQYSELFAPFASPMLAESTAVVEIVGYENAAGQQYLRTGGIWAFLGVKAGDNVTSGDTREYLPPFASDYRYVRPGGEGIYIYLLGTAVGPLLTEDEEVLFSNSLDIGNRRSFGVPYQGAVAITGSGRVLREGTGNLVNGVFTSDNLDTWDDVTPHEYSLEVSPTDVVNPNQTVVATPATYPVRFNLGTKLFVRSGTNRGRCKYRIVDGPKLITAKDRKIMSLGSDLGHIPIGADLVGSYLDRLVFVKDRIWYMSRQGNPQDYDYGADGTDRGRAVAGFASNAGLPGDPITAIASRGNDYLVLFARETTWVMRGDPAAGGMLLNISRSYGCVDPQAWCHGDLGEIYFLSKEGLCVLPDQAGSRPEPVSSESLPNELRNFDSNNVYVSLVFDVRYRGVWIFLTPKVPSQAVHYFYSKLTNSFWPIRFEVDGDQPTAAVAHTSSPSADAAVVLGCKNGSLRLASPLRPDRISGLQSTLVLGPFLSGPNPAYQGVLSSMVAMFGGEGAALTLDVFAADSPEEAVEKVKTGSPSFSIGLAGRRTRMFYPRVRSVAFCVRLRSSKPWGFEALTAALAPAGKARF